MNKWDETAFVFALVGIFVTLVGHWEGLMIVACALGMIGFGEPTA